jgi:DNA polymerase-1
MVWTPTDVHGATTTQATGLTESDPAFKELRSSIGKRTNFAKNYGAKRQRIRQMFPEKTEAEITKIDDAYYLAFPGVKYYHQYCYSVAQEFDCVTNLFGINYYGVNGHKLINMLIQGSSAYYLKWKMRVLYDYCQANNIQSRYILNIHDELQYERHISDPPELFFEFKKIMEDWPDTQVPIVTDMEVTTTNWAEKKGVHNVNELQLHIGN